MKEDFESRIGKEGLSEIWKDRLRVTDQKRKPVEVWKVVFDHFPPFLLSKKNGLRTNPWMDRWTDRPTNRWTYPLIEMHGRI